MKAVILAAGEGTRLLPLTENRSKNLIPVAGKPILEWIIESLRACNVTDLLLIVGRWKEAVSKHFGDGSRYGVKMEYKVQTEVDGTAHAILLAKQFSGGEPLLVLYGDIIVTPDIIHTVINSFHQPKSFAVMTFAQVDHPEFFGVADVDNGYVRRLIEKPLPGKIHSNLANAGIYAFNPEIFDLIENTPKSERGEYEITDSIKLALQKNQPVRAVILDQFSWLDIGRPWDLLEANGLILRRLVTRIDGEVEQGSRLVGPIVVEQGARVRSGSYIEGPAIIMSGADIGPNCYIRPFTTIGKNTRVGNACEVKNSIIMDDTKIPHLSYVGDSIIGERCNLGAGTTVANLRFDNAPIKMIIKDQLLDTGRRKFGAILGDDVETGVNCSLMPGVKVGSKARLGPGVVVYRDVQSGKSLHLSKESMQIE